MLEEGHRTLDRPELLIYDRLRLNRTMARAYGYAPVEVTVDGVERLAGRLSGITDNYNMNSHFCLSVLEFVEPLVLACSDRSRSPSS